MITPLLFLTLFATFTLGALFKAPRYGLYLYLLAFYMSPADTWWRHSVPNLRYLQIAGIAALIAVLLRADRFKDEGAFRSFSFRAVLIMVAWIWLVSLWAISPLQNHGCVLISKHLLIMFVVYRVTKESPELLRDLFFGVTLGTAWLGWMMFGKKGRIEQVAGAISDANTFGMYSAAALMLTAVLVLGFNGRYRLIAFLSAPLIVNSIVLAGSRGAFLAMILGGVAIGYFCPPQLKSRFKLYAVLASILFVLLAHNEFVERISGLFAAAEGEEKLDHSASSRIEVAKAGWKMALDYPMGVGFRGTAVLSPRYLAAEYLTRGSRLGQQSGRSAHNTIMDILVAYGFFGAGLYLLVHIWAARALLRLRAAARKYQDVRMGLLVAGAAGSLVATFVAGQFSSFVAAEMQYWLLGAIAAMVTMLNRADAMRDSGALPGSVVSLGPSQGTATSTTQT